MSFLTLWRQSAAEKHVQQRFVLQAKTIADVASVNQAALAENASLHAYAAQKIAEALALASSLGVDLNNRADSRHFWLTFFIEERTSRVLKEAEEEIRQVVIEYVRVTQGSLKWR